MSSDDPLLATSIHECGHGVMALLVGLAPLYVTNIPDATSGGRMYWAPGRRARFQLVDDVIVSDDHALALVYVAGVAAVRVLAETAADLAAVDEEHARAYARSADDDEERGVRALLSAAEAVFLNEHVRNATLALAYQLVRDRVVPNTAIESMIESVGLQRADATVHHMSSARIARDGTASSILGDRAFTERMSTRYFFGMAAAR